MRCVLQNYIIYKHNIAHINCIFSSSHIKKDKKETNEIYLNNIPYLSHCLQKTIMSTCSSIYTSSIQQPNGYWLMASTLDSTFLEFFIDFLMNTISCFPFPQMEWQKDNLFWNKQERAGLYLVQKKKLIKRLHERKLPMATN